MRAGRLQRQSLLVVGRLRRHAVRDDHRAHLHGEVVVQARVGALRRGLGRGEDAGCSVDGPGRRVYAEHDVGLDAAAGPAGEPADPRWRRSQAGQVGLVRVADALGLWPREGVHAVEELARVGGRGADDGDASAVRSGRGEQLGGVEGGRGPLAVPVPSRSEKRPRSRKCSGLSYAEWRRGRNEAPPCQRCGRRDVAVRVIRTAGGAEVTSGEPVGRDGAAR